MPHVCGQQFGDGRIGIWKRFDGGSCGRTFRICSPFGNDGLIADFGFRRVEWPQVAEFSSDLHDGLAAGLVTGVLRRSSEEFRHAAFPFAFDKGVKGVKPFKECRTSDRRKVIVSLDFGGTYKSRGGEIRTLDLLLPKQAR